MGDWVRAVRSARAILGAGHEELPRLFKRYERIDTKTGHKISGTGLGLVIARQIVEMHGGRIWAGRHEGGGSEFALAIPQAPRAVTSPDAKASVARAA